MSVSRHAVSISKSLRLPLSVSCHAESISNRLRLPLSASRHVRSQFRQVWNNHNDSEENQDAYPKDTSGDGRGPEIFGAGFLPLCGRQGTPVQGQDVER